MSLRDLPATITDLVGLQAKSPFPGRSLARHWQSASDQSHAPDDLVLSEIVDDDGKALASSTPTRSIAEEDKLYIRHKDGREELFDLESDPKEAADLSRSATAQPALTRFREALRKIER